MQALSSPSRHVRIGPNALDGDLTVPANAHALVIFAPPSGSASHTHCHDCVARALHGRHVATLLLDLLKPDEAHDRHKALDIDLQAQRMAEAIAWAAGEPGLSDLPVGLFGANTGTAVVLVAALHATDRVFAVVSRAGRTDLAPSLSHLCAPTLLIASDAEPVLLSLNRSAFAQLPQSGRMTVVPAAVRGSDPSIGHQHVAELAQDWFVQHLPVRAEAA